MSQWAGHGPGPGSRAYTSVTWRSTPCWVWQVWQEICCTVEVERRRKLSWNKELCVTLLGETVEMSLIGDTQYLKKSSYPLEESTKSTKPSMGGCVVERIKVWIGGRARVGTRMQRWWEKNQFGELLSCLKMAEGCLPQRTAVSKAGAYGSYSSHFRDWTLGQCSRGEEGPSSDLKGAVHHNRPSWYRMATGYPLRAMDTSAQLLSPVYGLPLRMGLPISVNWI